MKLTSKNKKELETGNTMKSWATTWNKITDENQQHRERPRTSKLPGRNNTLQKTFAQTHDNINCEM
jgi:hypothetical protein